MFSIIILDVAFGTVHMFRTLYS